MRHTALEVQLIEAHALSTLSGQIHGEQAVGGIWTTRWGVFQNIHHALKARPCFALDQVFFLAVGTLFLHDLQSAIANRLGHKVHALVVHAQVVHHLRTLERVHGAGQTLKASEAVNQLGLKRQTTGVSANLVDHALLFGNKFVSDVACGGESGVGISRLCGAVQGTAGVHHATLATQTFLYIATGVGNDLFNFCIGHVLDA